MDMGSLFAVITPWHWLVLALILLGLEIMLGTYDLLWISAAAFLTTGFSALPLPQPLGSWEAQAISFAVFGVGLLIAGRTVFADLKSKGPSDRPSLNKRGQSLVGSKAVVAVAFINGEGRVKLGDTTWTAQSVTNEDFAEGAHVVVSGVSGTILKVSLVA